MTDINLFGEPIIKDVILRDKFIEPPFSVLDTKQGGWQARKRLWKSLGLQSEIGRNVTGRSTLNDLKNNPRKAESANKIMNTGETISIFDPALCEVLYHWFCPQGGNILDPFAGGSVRGIVANYLGYFYTGIDLRPEQIESNISQGLNILGADRLPNWLIGDSNKVLDEIDAKYDMVFSCPPYFDLEVYSDLPDDLSTMNYQMFSGIYKSIIHKSCSKLKPGGYACFVIGEVRDKDGNYIGFVPQTINCFTSCGMKYYNEAILLNSIASASMRADNGMKNKKLCKVHQNVLIFKKS